MIALPVLAVTAADVVIQTSQVTRSRALDRRLGSADALVDGAGRAARRWLQAFDPTTAARRPPTRTKAVPPTRRRDLRRASAARG